MNQAQLERYRQALLELRPQLRDEIEHLVEVLPEELHSPGDDWQEPSEAFDVEMEAEHSQEKLYEQVTSALERIEQGTFGRCLGCGRTIGEERLSAVPYAEYCVDCERQRERR